jgi:hypothetical protein
MRIMKCIAAGPFSAFIEPLVCLSTVHLTKETCDTYSEVGPEIIREQGVVSYPNEYGCFVRVPSGNEIEDLQGENTPTDMLKVLCLANAFGLSWVKFDPDGEEVDFLPTYHETWQLPSAEEVEA